MINLLDITKQVIQIAQDAGSVILEIYNAPTELEVAQKKDNSPLTLADKAANQIICSGLEQLPVKFPIISEENKEIDYEERRQFEYAWLVDPLDGTKEFIAKNGEFTVNIALIHQQQIVMGVVYTPALDETYWAVKGEGAYQVVNGAHVRLHAPTFAMSDAGLGVVCSRSHMSEETEAFVNQLHHPNLVSRGSSLKFLLVAKGEAHLYPRLAPTMEWDTGAAQIIVEEAGGKVIDEETKMPLLYNKPNLLNPYFIAYGAVFG
jgi:3'(2'), 5'-bisphosphate nucleotidase